MAWDLLARDEEGGDGALCLYRDGGDFMIRAGGLELMSTRCSRSELELARIGLAATAGLTRRRILIAGLGLGFTLAEACRGAGPRDRITLVELSAAVIAWVRAYLETGSCLDDPRVAVRRADFLDFVAREGGAYDLILLDIDNGPEAFVRPDNQLLYEVPGLVPLLARMAPGGRLLIWSSFEAPAFEARLRTLGQEVDCLKIRPSAGKPVQHYIYRATSPARGAA